MGCVLYAARLNSARSVQLENHNSCALMGPSSGGGPADIIIYTKVSILFPPPLGCTGFFSRALIHSSLRLIIIVQRQLSIDYYSSDRARFLGGVFSAAPNHLAICYTFRARAAAGRVISSHEALVAFFFFSFIINRIVK